MREDVVDMSQFDWRRVIFWVEIYKPLSVPVTFQAVIRGASNIYWGTYRFGALRINIQDNWGPDWANRNQHTPDVPHMATLERAPPPPRWRIFKAEQIKEIEAGGSIIRENLPEFTVISTNGSQSLTGIP